MLAVPHNEELCVGTDLWRVDRLIDHDVLNVIVVVVNR